MTQQLLHTEKGETSLGQEAIITWEKTWQLQCLGKIKIFLEGNKKVKCDGVCPFCKQDWKHLFT